MTKLEAYFGLHAQCTDTDTVEAWYSATLRLEREFTEMSLLEGLFVLTKMLTDHGFFYYVLTTPLFMEAYRQNNDVFNDPDFGMRVCGRQILQDLANARMTPIGGSAHWRAMFCCVHCGDRREVECYWGYTCTCKTCIDAFYLSFI